MADDPRQRNMSLVPYQPAESREIVLRHGSSVVVYDQHSKQFSLRDVSHSSSVNVTDCPYCHRPMNQESQEGPAEHDATLPSESGFVNPGYFRMLHRSLPASSESSRSASPQMRIGEPLPPAGNNDTLRPLSRPEIVISGPEASSTPHGISSSAFSQNYFKTFFVEERELGRGGKGVVLLVRHILDGVPLGHFACKRVPVGDDHTWLEKVLIEVQLLQNLSHQNLVSYRHVWLEDYQTTSFGPKIPCAFILQQYCNAGDLYHYILDSARTSFTTQELKDRIRRKSRGQLDLPRGVGPRRMPFEEILSFFKDITSGLNHIHANGYIHRDLKPSNCLLHTIGHKTRVLVSDFGEVQVVNMARKSTGATGTISYCAPEVLRRGPNGALGNFTTKSDIFSLGMIVYFMCFCKLPYRNADGIDEDNEDLDLLREEICTWAGLDEDQRTRINLPEKLYMSLQKLLAIDPTERPGTDEILKGIKAGSMLDGLGGFTPQSYLDDLGPRISRVDSPSPSSSKLHHARNSSSNSISFSKPGPSRLRPTSPVPGQPASPSTPSTPSGYSSPIQQNNSATSSSQSSVILHPRKKAESEITPLLPTSPRVQPPRMILPPPPTLRSHFGNIYSHPLAAATTKFVVFLFKIVSLFQPCAPFAPSAQVTYPLLCLASLDFLLYAVPPNHGTFSTSFGLGRSVTLLFIHSLVLFLAQRNRVLCSTDVSRDFIWTDS